jgi:hypothetical protein
MTKLSLAAEAVLDAYMNNCGWLDGPFEKDYRCAAAVLRAAADQVAPGVYFVYTGNRDWDHGMEARNDAIREAIFAIATELEAIDEEYDFVITTELEAQ